MQNLTIKRADRQLPLIPVWPIYNADSNATARNAYGQAAEDIVCAALGLRSIPIDGRYDVCFDAESPTGDFYEIKSCHERRGKVVIYDWRMKKEEAFYANLYYAILLHTIAGERSDILRKMADKGCAILVLPASDVHAIAAVQPLNTVKFYSNPRFGYSRKGYKDGYRNVPIDALLKLADHFELREFSLFGTTCTVRILSYGLPH